MKTEEEMIAALNKAITSCVRADSFEELRYFQGQVNVLEWWFAKPEEVNDAFKGEERTPAKEKKDE